jgi:uncharacterized membrane protein YeaQ/YmgE (transglycosylase-associated protein family)
VPWQANATRRAATGSRIRVPIGGNDPPAWNVEGGQQRGGPAMGILWTIIIGFVAGIIAKFLMPGDNEPSGFIVTTILGIVGAFVATWLGQSLGWYRPGEGAGLIGAVVGAVIVLAVWSMLVRNRAVSIR